MERFLYRLSQSEYFDMVVLKGALMFVVWEAPRSRATRDIDLLGHMDNSVDSLAAMVKDICNVTVEPDGVVFNISSIRGERIKEDADYEGARIGFTANIGQARALIQVDIGFGDPVFPVPGYIDYPTILDMPHPRLKGYPRETVVAEKFVAMVQLGIVNSRMKDFYDIWLLANQFDFSGKTLQRAIRQTFTTRKILLTNEPLALSDTFSSDPEKMAQWKAFVRRSRLEHAPADLKTVTDHLRTFLLPVTKGLAKNDPTPIAWRPPGPWQ